MDTRSFITPFYNSPYRMYPKLPLYTWGMPKTHVFAPFGGHDMCNLRAISGVVRATLTYHPPLSSIDDDEVQIVSVSGAFFEKKKQ